MWRGEPYHGTTAASVLKMNGMISNLIRQEDGLKQMAIMYFQKLSKKGSGTMKKIIMFFLCTVLVFSLTGCGSKAEKDASILTKVGTWKTAQTIQPFFYQDYLETNDVVEVTPFTNPGDMKTALLAGSLDMCGTTLVTAITAASKGEPVVVVCGLSNKCSALVVGKDSNIKTVADLKGKKIAYVPGTMHHLLLLEALTGDGVDP